MLLPSLISLALASTARAVWDCSSPLELEGRKYDLSSLKGERHWEVSIPTPPTITKTSYRLSLCAPLTPIASTPSADQCEEGTNLCATTYSTREGLEDRITQVRQVVKMDGPPEVTKAEGEGVGEGKRWMMRLGGGRWADKELWSKVEMVCSGDSSAETVPTFQSFDTSTGTLYLKWSSAAACPVGSEAPPPKDDEGGKEGGEQGGDKEEESKGGMGWFGWLVTLSFLAFVTYLLLGSYSNYTQYGATGWDALPHRDVWRDLPFVVGDLFKGRGGSRNGYSALG